MVICKTCFRVITLVAIVLFLASCRTNSLTQDDTSLSKLRDIYDIVPSYFGQKPEPGNEITYSDSREFDLKLHVSLKADLERVKVITPNNMEIENSRLPQRIDHWFSTVRSEGGEVKACPTEAPVGTGFGALSIATDIFYALVKGVDNFITYRPAKQYHAIVFVSLNDPNNVKGISFIRKDVFEGFDDRCEDLSE